MVRVAPFALIDMLIDMPGGILAHRAAAVQRRFGACSGLFRRRATGGDRSTLLLGATTARLRQGDRLRRDSARTNAHRTSSSQLSHRCWTTSPSPACSGTGCLRSAPQRGSR